MNRFYGTVGFVSTEEDPEGYGVFKEKVVEKKYYGDFVSSGYRRDDNQVVNPNIRLSNRVSLLTDPYAFKNASYIAYVTIAGTKWAVSSIEFQGKRLICTFKGIYREGITDDPQTTTA